MKSLERGVLVLVVDGQKTLFYLDLPLDFVLQSFDVFHIFWMFFPVSGTKECLFYHRDASTNPALEDCVHLTGEIKEKFIRCQDNSIEVLTEHSDVYALRVVLQLPPDQLKLEVLLLQH